MSFQSHSLNNNSCKAVCADKNFVESITGVIKSLKEWVHEDSFPELKRLKSEADHLLTSSEVYTW
jgi:hypothetical protein